VVKRRCVLVDDSEEFLASAARLLESQGIEVVAHATCSDDALAHTATHAPDVVLVDIELADEDGIALAEQLAEQAPASRVVLISAHDRDDLAELLRDSSAVGFIPKRSLGAPAIHALLGTY
jgi:two-component system, NarL family, nitrate/nitrite response regulator NarL